jgi:hypothetical protein
MSIKKKVFAVAATMTMVGGVSAVGLMSADASTTPCGSCVSVFSQEFGTYDTPNFVLDVLRQGEKVGQPLILFRTSNSDPAEDFIADTEETVNDLYSAGLVGSAVAMHYGCVAGTGTYDFPSCAGASNDNAYEFEYSPYGVNSNLCAGVGSTAGNGTPVVLENCGVSSKTIWIEDSADSMTMGYLPLINGSDTNFSHPYVLHYPGNGYPTDMPRPGLNTYTLQEYSSGAVYNNEQWGIITP